MQLIKNKTCSVTGHRKINYGFDREKLKETFVKIIKGGKDTFLIGMAVGFDSVCFEVLQELKKDFSIKIIAVIPCADQNKYFSKEQKEKYKKYLNESDDKLILYETYNNYCMHERNRFLVDNSSLLLAYIYKNSGGTYMTVKYAIKNKVTVFYI